MSIRIPTHPGAILREDVLPALNITAADLAEKLQVSKQLMSRILNEKGPVTPNIAIRIGEFIGNDPNVWLGMQQAYDLVIARRALAKTLPKIRAARKAMKTAA
jgi:addiction module HigA family antidote